MGIFDEMVTAVVNYPPTNVVLEIVEVAFPDDALNEGEIGSFKVKVTNNGALNMNNVTLLVKGTNGAKVKNDNALELFDDDTTTDAILFIRGHEGSQVTNLLKFRAPSEKQSSKVLIEATIAGWDADLDHILNGHSDPVDQPKGTYATEVVEL